MSVSSRPPLPEWAQSVRAQYLSGQSALFLLHGNVFDVVLYDGRQYALADFLAEVLLEGNKDTVISYDPANKSSVRKGEPPKYDGVEMLRDPLAALQGVLEDPERKSVALLIGYAGSIVPPGEESLLLPQDRANVVRVNEWAQMPCLTKKDSVAFLFAESPAEINTRLLSNPRIAAIEVPLPNEATRRQMIEALDTGLNADIVQRLATHTAGLRLLQLEHILRPQPPHAAESSAQDAPAVSVGMLLNTAGSEPADERIFSLVSARKRDIIDRECSGLIEFIDSQHDLSVVGGNERVIVELMEVAAILRGDDPRQAPKGIMMVGPMGTGKSYLARGFIKSSGLPAVMLKNFRNKYVGATEANLEKVLRMLRALGPAILLIDEIDRAFGGEEQESDGGTSSRVIGRIKEFMGDDSTRGQVLCVVMTNRPDKLDADIKRPGRIDLKIPLFYEDTQDGVRKILQALARRNRLQIEDFGDLATIVGYSNADLEALTVLAMKGARRAASPVTPQIFKQAVDDYLPSRDVEMIEYMNLLAVFEASSRAMLPERYRNMPTDDLNRLLVEKKPRQRR
jgi:hypothetical protein